MYLSRLAMLGRFGIYCASFLPAARRKGLLEGVTVTVACRKDGVIHAAEAGETLHAQIRLRIGPGDEIDDGFLVG